MTDQVCAPDPETEETNRRRRRARPEPNLPVALPTHIWSEIVGLLWSVAWTDPSAPEVGRLAAQLYVAYCRASGIDPTRAADLLILLPEQLRQQVRDHG